MSQVLEIEDPIKGHYTLEVSSPGFDRILRKRAHFERFLGERIFAELKLPIDGRRRFVGVLKSVADDSIVVEVDGQPHELAARADTEGEVAAGVTGVLRAMNKEILMAVDAVSNEKGVDKEIIFDALEAALASATRKKHGEELDVRVSINRKTGGYDTFRRWKVFADDSTELEVPERELRMDDAREIDKDVEPGGYVEEPMESVPFGRILAQTAKQVIVQKVREAERAQVVDAYKDRAGHAGQRHRQARRPQRRIRRSRRECGGLRRARGDDSARARALAGPHQGLPQGGAHASRADRSCSCRAPRRNF